MTDTVTIPRAEFEQIKEALEFYREAENWRGGTPDIFTKIEADGGIYAKEALAILEKHGGAK